MDGKLKPQEEFTAVLRRDIRAARSVPRWSLGVLLMLLGSWSCAFAQQDYLLVPGDILRVSVFKNPEMSLDARIAEGGAIGFPLLGSVQVAGLTPAAAERKIAQQLKDGGFVLNPQVNILLTQALGNLVSVLGQVNRPGRYALDVTGGHVSGMLASAGGIAPTGADLVVVTGTRNGKEFHREIDTLKLSSAGGVVEDIALMGGDTVFVNRAKQFYIYGQVQRPGQFRLESGMTVMQALAAGGGVTGKGSRRGIVIHRRGANGKITEMEANLDDDVQDVDVLYVKESLF